jgi:hypothetical protein
MEDIINQIRKFGAMLTLIVGIVLMSGCIPRLFPTRLHLDNVQSITIHDHWSGLHPANPIEADYSLTMDSDGGLVGVAMFSVASGTRTLQESVAIPADVVEEFLQTLETSLLNRGRYTPFFDHTDDYPNIALVVRNGDEFIEVYTESQSESGSTWQWFSENWRETPLHRQPWGARIRGVEYTIDSDIPEQALARLQSYLKTDVLDAMVYDAAR